MPMRSLMSSYVNVYLLRQNHLTEANSNVSFEQSSSLLISKKGGVILGSALILFASFLFYLFFLVSNSGVTDENKQAWLDGTVTTYIYVEPYSGWCSE